ncbi:MAG: RluA family pseudouridine synthase [Leptolyngbya sp. PLA3]|nr:MAG: RluA family pseudouridine synthase [Cyanobacteria bacterium CYA]MCE7967633.1 RluA family pseudouridine synthase [Leptolyngbya sp. PL-A3]
MRVLFEHPRFVIIDKPAGMLSVPGRGQINQVCARSHVAGMYPSASGPMVCHRLDQPTSGLIVFALDHDAQRHISLQFQRRRAEKRYIALLRGRPSQDEGVVDLPLRTDWERRPRQMVDFEHGARAITLWRVLEVAQDETGRQRTRVEFRPITGKTHQLRIHAQAAHRIGGLDCPIVGDVLYDPDHPAGRLMLHASELTITDPDTLRRVTVRSEPPF